MVGPSQRIVENSQTFSPQLRQVYVFTQSVQGLSITDLVRQLGMHLRGPHEIASRAIYIGTETADDQTPSHLRLHLKRRACRFGGFRWWAACPRCRKSVALLYFADAVIACRKCHGLKYLSQMCSDAPRLMHHYARLREDIDRRPGPKPKRYWRYLTKEDFYVRKVMIGMHKWAARLKK